MNSTLSGDAAGWWQAKLLPRQDEPARVRVAAGFGSSAQDSVSHSIDLNEALVLHPQATFFMRAQGQGLVEAGIEPGDVLVVDRALSPANGQVVVAVVGDELCCRRLPSQGGPGLEPFTLWGVVTHVIKTLPV